jgi:signal transduction histidine kinase
LKDAEAARALDCLRTVPLFQGLSDDKLAWISEHADKVKLDAGSVIARQGDPPDGFYVVMDGETQWTRRVGQEDVFVVTLGEGSMFAELIMVLDAPYPMTGYAVTDVGLLKLGAKFFWEMLRICPEVLRGILATSVERAELHESVSQRHGKLISLGTLAAGLAHELNNPAAAARRSAEDLQESLDTLRSAGLILTYAATAGELTPQALEALEHAIDASGGAETLGELEISEREEDLAFWLEDSGVSEGWTLATAFVSAGLGVTDLQPIVESVPPTLRTDALRYLAAMLGSTGLVDEVKGSALRISGIVETIEGYSYMDRAPVQDVNVNGSLDDTLAVLEHRLDGIEVARDYDPELPRITAYGGELNQVWTNLLDNAIDAIASSEGSGRITLKTGCDRDRVLVEVADDGPGIPPEDHARIFEPFFTTKDVGRGTGLDLDVSYRIVVGRHGGDIHVVSEPGGTRFEVRLPVDEPGDPEAVVGRDLRMETGA